MAVDPLPQSQVFSETTAGVAADLLLPRPHLAGGQAALVRYAEPSERPLGRLGAYAMSVDTTYAWPGRPAGGIVDLATARVWIEDAVLRYYADAIGGGDTIAPVANVQNRIRTDGDGFAANGDDYPRAAALYDRDVAVGDYVRIAVGGTVVETAVQALVADVVAASVTGTTADAANAVSQPNSQVAAAAPSVAVTGGGAGGGLLAAGTYYLQYAFTGPFGTTWGSAAHAGATPVTFTSASGNIPRVTLPSRPTGATAISLYVTAVGGAAGTEVLYASGITAATYDMAIAVPAGAAVPASAVQTAGTANNVTAVATGTAYRGDAVGDTYEQYTITVTTGSTGGDATTAVLSVLSASGRDDAAAVVPAAFGAATPIGARGLTVTWTAGGSELVAGQVWTVAVRQAFVAPAGTGGGTYTGTEQDESLVYRVLVSRGGRYADGTQPQVTVTRTDGGAGTSQPVTVTAAATAVAIGSGLTIQFDANGATPGLRKGDVYYVAVTSASTGAYRTIVTADNLPAAVLAASDLTLWLGIRKTIEIPAQRLSAPPATNWQATADDLTLADGIDAYDSTLTDDGVAFAVAVVSGTAYADYRAWLPTAAGRLSRYLPASTDPLELKADVAALLGTVDPLNPLAYGLWKAAVNANLTAVLYTGIADPTDPDEWQECLDALKGNKEAAALVPLTTDAAVLAAYSAHVLARSADEVGGEWRSLWLSPPTVTVKAVVTADSASDGAAVLATLSDNSLVTGTQYTVLDCPAGNGRFLTNGVRRGDTVRYLYSQDDFGEPTWTEFTVASVPNEDSIVLISGGEAAVSSAQRMEVWRALSRTEVAAEWVRPLAAATARHRYVWPATVEDAGASVAGYFLAAALAAYSCAVAPHQSLRNLEVTGFDGASQSTAAYSNAQLNALADAGAFVVTATADGRLYTLFARTPDRTSAATGEESAQRAADAVRYVTYGRIASYFGLANVTPDALSLMRGELQSAMGLLRTGVTVPRLGPLVADVSLTALRPHATLPDRVVAQFAVTLTYPANEATITLVL